MSGASGATAASSPGAVAMATTGGSCRPGESPSCTCDSTHTQGTRVCLFDPNGTNTSMGQFSECRNCAAPVKQDGGPGDVKLADAGTKGAAGGSAGSSSNTGAGGGTGGARSTGYGGRGGTTMPPATGGKCPSPCTQICFPIGILPCCNALGICGCTWAPGAYCL